MTDILVTSPFRPFTLPTQFKAVFNGYIYCGTVDAVDPSVSQVQVYLVNESGDKVPVAQPLRTNAGGFLVYNGQPAKFVTNSNHSLLVRDSLGNQLWYAPDVSKADPDAVATIIGSQAREALRRSYAEAGRNLVDGSFEAGGTLVNANDVLLQERTGKAFSGPAGTVATGTDPTSGGFVDQSANLSDEFAEQVMRLGASLDVNTDAVRINGHLYPLKLVKSDTAGTVTEINIVGKPYYLKVGHELVYLCDIRFFERDRVNVRAFWATGDGVNDDLPCTQAASDSMQFAFGQDYYASASDKGVAHLHFPRGIYRHSGTLNIPRGLLVTGDNARNHGGTTIYNSSTAFNEAINLYYRFDSASGPQYIADQQISGLMIRNANGGAFRAKRQADGAFYSCGSLSIEKCFFLGLSSPIGTIATAIDTDTVERVMDCTFDAGAYRAIQTERLANCNGNEFFSSTYASIKIINGPNNALSSIVGNAFYNIGDNSVAAIDEQACVSVVNVTNGGVLFDDNTVSGNGGGARICYAVGSNSVSVINNKCHGIIGDPVLADRCTLVFVENNEFRECGKTSSGNNMVSFKGCNIGAIKNNKFFDCGGTLNIHVDADCNNILVQDNWQDVERTSILSANCRVCGNTSGMNLGLVNRPQPSSNWIYLSDIGFRNGWTSGGAQNRARVRVDYEGNVVFAGAISGGSNGVVFCTLPAELRPASGASVSFIVATQVNVSAPPSEYGMVVVNGAGDCYITVNGASISDYVCLESIRFSNI